MSKHDKHATEPAPTAGQKPPEAVADSTMPGAAAAPPAEDELTRARRELDELRDKNLRLVAELQNQQKRTQREKQEALRYAEAEFARDLLVVLDDLNRTLEVASTAADVQTVVDGVRIIYEHFLKVLEQRQIKCIEAVGKPFNPAFHEALMQQPSPEHPAGTVLAETARGYTMHERVLRPSRVILSSGPPPTPADEGKKQEVSGEVS
jgi:molecular chaperone GrpE